MYPYSKVTKKFLQQFNQVIIILAVYMDENKLVIMPQPKTICFDLRKDVDNNLKHEIDSIIKYNKFLAGHKIKIEIS